MKNPTLVIGAGLITLGLTTGLIYAIWNFLIVAAFKLPMITWSQALMASVGGHIITRIFRGKR